MHKKRPNLVEGDVVRGNKSKQRMSRILRLGTTAVVVKIRGRDASDGKAIVTIENEYGRQMVDRRLLWKTGHNIYWKAAQPHFNSKAVELHADIHIGDLIKEPKEETQNRCTCSIETIMNFGCKCGGK